jgi:hypothetical protein
MSEEAGGVTWADIYESPQGERSLRRLPRLCREAVRRVWAAGRHELLVVLAIKAVSGVGLAVVLLLGKGVLDGVIAAGRSGAGSSWMPTTPRPSTTGWSGRPAAASSGPGRSSRG